MQQTTMILSAIITILFANSAMAILPFDLQSIEKQFASQKKEPMTKRIPDSCADFSGKWVGECTSEKDTINDELTIEQDRCSSITFIQKEGRQIYYISPISLKSITDVMSVGSIAAIISARWSPDQQIIFIDAAALLNSPYLASVSKLKVSAQMMFDSNGDLLGFSKVEQDFMPENQSKNCRYRRQ